MAASFSRAASSYDSVAELQALITALDKTVPVFSSGTSANAYSDAPLSAVVYDAQAASLVASQT